MFAIMILTLIISNHLFSHYSKIILKEWDTDLPLSSWVFKWYDKWGGSNYQCLGELISDCHIYSWKAEYPLLISEPDPCPQNNTVQYGENLSRYEAIQNGTPVPDTTIFSFSIYEIYK